MMVSEIWQRLIKEATQVVESESLLRKKYERYLLKRISLAEGLSFMLSDSLADEESRQEWQQLILSVYENHLGPYDDERTGTLEWLAVTDL